MLAYIRVENRVLFFLGHIGKKNIFKIMFLKQLFVLLVPLRVNAKAFGVGWIAGIG